MDKTLLYNGIEYSNFTINEFGVVKNLKTGNILKPTVHKKSGYVVVYLPMGKRGSVKSIRLHRAIAEAFIPNPNNLPVVNHIDEDKTNYSVSNLEWVTSEENTRKHYEILEKGDWYCNNRKLSVDDVIYIRNNANTVSLSYLSKLFGVSLTTISNVINRKTYNFI